MTNEYLEGVIQIPSVLEITAATKAFPMVLTVDVDAEVASNTYIAGQKVVLTIPRGYGMQQADGLIAKITNVSGNEITLDVDSRGFDTFSEPATGLKPASMAPYGSQNLTLNNSASQVPFQSLNNLGN